MAYLLATQSTQPDVQIDGPILYDYLLNHDKRAESPRLAHIQEGQVYFTTTMFYPIHSKVSIRYRVTYKIPLTDPIFQGPQLIMCLTKKTSATVTFKVEGYVNARGEGIGITYAQQLMTGY